MLLPRILKSELMRFSPPSPVGLERETGPPYQMYTFPQLPKWVVFEGVGLKSASPMKMSIYPSPFISPAEPHASPNKYDDSSESPVTIQSGWFISNAGPRAMATCRGLFRL